MDRGKMWHMPLWLILPTSWTNSVLPCPQTPPSHPPRTPSCHSLLPPAHSICCWILLLGVGVGLCASLANSLPWCTFSKVCPLHTLYGITQEMEQGPCTATMRSLDCFALRQIKINPNVVQNYSQLFCNYFSKILDTLFCALFIIIGLTFLQEQFTILKPTTSIQYSMREWVFAWCLLTSGCSWYGASSNSFPMGSEGRRCCRKT